MSNLENNGPRKVPLAELKRAARSVKSRHPAAVAKRNAATSSKQGTGGRGSVARGPHVPAIDQLSSVNIPQKGPVPSQDTPPGSVLSEAPPHPTPAVALTREDRWRGAGDICATVVALPPNPRMLLILLPGGKRGRAVIHPVDRLRFFVRKPIWVRPEGDSGEVYRVVGKYSRWGVRHS